MHEATSPIQNLLLGNSRLDAKWRFFQGTVEEITPFGGRQCLFYWPENGKIHKENEKARVQGGEAWGRQGVAVSLMSSLAVTSIHRGLVRYGLFTNCAP